VGNRPLSRLTLLRKIYRVLLNTGRSYAAFTPKEKELVAALREKKEIFDPMAGYGSLTRYCGELGLRSYCVEYNVPQFLWQLLLHPTHTRIFIHSCNVLLSQAACWPRCRIRARASDDWFPEESRRILLALFAQTRRTDCRNQVAKPRGTLKWAVDKIFERYSGCGYQERCGEYSKHD
jgi:hypothetical protein